MRLFGEGTHHRGNEDIVDGARLDTREALGRNTDDGVGVIADVESAAEHFGIAAEAAGPVFEREDGDGTGARVEIVGVRNQTTERGTQAKYSEHAAGDVLPVRLLWLLIWPVGHTRAIRRGDGEQVGLIAHGRAHPAKLGIAGTGAKLGLAININSAEGESVEALRIRDRQGPQEEGVDNAESGGTGTYCQCKRKNRRERSDAMLVELAPAED